GAPADDGLGVLEGPPPVAGQGAAAAVERRGCGAGVDDRGPVRVVVHRAAAPGRGDRGDGGGQHGPGRHPHGQQPVLDGGSAGARVRARADRRAAWLLVGRLGGGARRGQADQGERPLLRRLAVRRPDHGVAVAALPADPPGGGRLMADEPEQITPELAIRNAARLLRAAELETNLALMERLDELATSWLSLAHLLMEREAV